MREISVMRNFQGYFSRTFQDLKLQFPGLSRTKVIFQDFPGPGDLKKKSRTFQDFPGGVGTLCLATTIVQTTVASSNSLTFPDISHRGINIY